MRIKILKIFIIISGVLSIFLFIVVNLKESPSFLMDNALVNKQRKLASGDLYNLCRVEYFDVELPELKYIESDRLTKNLDEADILISGDSFFENARGMKTIPELIGDSLGMKFFYDSTCRPLTIIPENYNKSRRKYLLFENVERNIPSAFIRPHTLQDRQKNRFTVIKESIFPKSKEDNFSYILRNGKITGDIFIKFMSFRFNLFGLISDATPAYGKNPDWLHYFPDVTGNSGFYHKFSEEEINILADKIKELRDILNNTYNIELVYIAVPNKYTLYHTFLNNDTYNGFIPRLNSALESRGVKTINIYDRFKASKEILYYQTDSHWNNKGEMFALEIILKKLREYMGG